MNLVTRTLILLLINVCWTTISFSQTAAELGLFARGRLSEGKAIHSRGKVLWTGKLLMEFENRGKKSIILIDPRLALGTGLSKVEFYFSGRDTDNHDVRNRLGFTESLHPSASQSETLRTLASILDSERPPDNLTVILEPGSAITFEDNIEIAQKYSFIKNDGPGLDGVSWEGSSGWFKDSVGLYVNQVGLPVGEADYATATYEFSLASITESPDLLDKVSSRWKNYGDMPKSPSGTYQITTEPIKVRKGFEKIDWPAPRRSLTPSGVSYAL